MVGRVVVDILGVCGVWRKKSVEERKDWVAIS
jgi:hypothetical protein